MSAEYSAAPTLTHLREFQRRTVEHVFDRLYLASDSTRRFLVADETGLGKTHVAQGVIAKAVERLQHDDSVRRIDIVYVCSNGDIAAQNVRKLQRAITVGAHALPGAARATRLTLLIRQPGLLQSSAPRGAKPVTFVSFTPATSFDLGWQTGTAEERATLYLLLSEELKLRWASGTARAMRRILQGNVARLERFENRIRQVESEIEPGNTPDGTDRIHRWEPHIERDFRRAFRTSKASHEFEMLIEDVRGRSVLSADQKERARELTSTLRRMLARSSVRALEPDLIVLDEFQRFRRLLEGQTEAGELAETLFSQPMARVLLLSATPYKAFTHAEDRAEGDDHYSDFGRTLAFLANNDEAVTEIRQQLASFRRATLSGADISTIRRRLETDLTRLLCRTERPILRDGNAPVEEVREASDVEPHDLAGFVALHRLAEALETKVNIEYWKSAPYFANFLDGYQVGEHLRSALKDADRRAELRPLLRATQRIHRDDVARFREINWGNARLRRIAADTVDQGWWRLLWVPPSLRYHAPGTVFAEVGADGFTKRLIFSSWSAAPTAVAAMLSYEAERQISTAVQHFENTARGRESFRSRFAWRLAEGRPGAMTSLMLFWPCPTLARATDPLTFAQTSPDQELPIESLNEWSAQQVRSMGVGNGEGTSSASGAWYWATALGLGADGALLPTETDESSLRDALLGIAGEDSSGEGDASDRGLVEHISEALRALQGERPTAERPHDLVEVSALLGVAGPGNVAWRALVRVVDVGQAVTPLGLWRAAAVLASGIRSLFARRESHFLLDGIARHDEDAYWRVVLNYCRDGNLQAVLDEYVHHLAEGEGFDLGSDDGMLALAHAARRALALRPATYRAVDPLHPEGSGIPFLSRFALRYGGPRNDAEDVRLPEVRAAFNSPFWPFVLASTSVGQEGVDFHWWCHSLVHWNLPANPVDFEQREGRVNRYKGHAIRRNIALGHRADILRDIETADPWSTAFRVASEAPRSDEIGDLQPCWVYPGPVRVERCVLGYPLSRDQQRWDNMRDVLALYRLAYGQPRQDDMVDLLRRRGLAADPASVAELRLSLRPPATSGSEPSDGSLP